MPAFPPPRTTSLCAVALWALALAACDAAGGERGLDGSLPGLPVRTGLAGRLTRAQHGNIALDVLGVRLTEQELAAPGSGIPQETPSTGLFRSGADGQAAADNYPLAFGKLAALVAARVDPAALDSDFSQCSVPAAACRGAAVARLGLPLFRRPLSEREVEAFSSLHAAAEAEGLSFEQALRSVLEAMLQSPAFVFRLEQETSAAAGEKRYLDGFELAARLSLFLWESAPDTELLVLAETGALSGSPAALPVVRQQVQRMLADPRARRMTREFITDFAEAERAAFVGVTPALRAALAESMAASFDAHLWQEKGQIKGLFTTTRLSMDSSVARLIGLTPATEGQHVYDVSGLPERVGWLTHPGFIAGVGDAEVGKIVHRGIALMIKLMCRQPAQLPEGVAALATEFSREFSDRTERERSEQRRLMAKPVAEGGGDNPACWGCHSQFEPLAYGFDRFDAAGRYVGAYDAQGRDLPIDGWMTDDLSVEEAGRARYRDMTEFMALMAESDTVQACMAEHFLAFATGRASSGVEKDFSFGVHSTQQRAGGTLGAMAEAVATSELFRALQASAASNAGAED